MTSRRPRVNVLYPKCVITNNFRTKKYKNMKIGILDIFRLLNWMGTNIFQNIYQKCQYCDVIISPGSNIYTKWANANNFGTNKYENLKFGILDIFRTLNWMETTTFQNIHKKCQYSEVIIPRGPIYTQNGPTPITLGETNMKTWNLVFLIFFAR